MKKFIPSQPYLQQGDDLIEFLALHRRFRTVCSTIAFANVSKSTKRLAMEGANITHEPSIRMQAIYLLAHLENWNDPGSFHIKNTLKQIAGSDSRKGTTFG